MKVGNKVLGVAVGQKSFLVAEVVSKGERHAVSHCAEFIFPEGLSLSTPEKLGESFRQFLKTHQIHTKDTVIGLPAKRLVTRRKEVPPAAPALAASTLRLQAEGEFSSELDNLVMDFAGSPSTAEATTVLLIATNKVVVDECQAMAAAAGLRLHAITSTTAALGRATSRLPGGDGLVLSIGPNGAELVVQHGADPAHLKHLNVVGGTESISALAGEIRRMMAAIPRNGTPQTMALWNSGGAENPQSILEQRLSMPVTTPEVANLVLAETPNTEGYGPAVSLALAAMEATGLPVDFLHSRLAPPKTAGLGNVQKIGIAVGVLLVGVAAYGYVDYSSLQGDVDRQAAINAKNAKTVADAKDWTKRGLFAKSWLPAAPINIEVLRDVTNLFPQQGNTIWATRLSTGKDNLHWEMDGKATDQRYPQDIVDKMMEIPERFTNPSITHRDAETTTGYWAFKLEFIYTPKPATQPAVAPLAATPGRSNSGGGPGAGNMPNNGGSNNPNNFNNNPNNNNNGNNGNNGGNRNGRGGGGRGGGGGGFGGRGGFGGAGGGGGAVDTGTVDPNAVDNTGGN